MMIRLAVTGHRPNKLYGYNRNNLRYDALYRIMKDEIIEVYNTDNEMECITGMALGADTIFAMAVLELKSLGYNIRLVCAIPFKGQENRWKPQDINVYNYILKHSDEVVYVSTGGYAVYKLQKRNKYIIDRLSGPNDKLIAVWDGSHSGTGNCIEYAKSKNIKINYINPLNIFI